MKSSFKGSAIVFIATTVAVLSHCKDPEASQRSLPSSANVGAANCLANPLELTNSSWNDGIGQIFVNNCSGCHPGSQQTNYITYAGVKANAASVASKIQSGSMPKGQTMSATDKAAITAWALAGAPEGAATGTPSPTVDPNGGVDTSGSGTTSGCAGTSPTYDPSTDGGGATPTPTFGAATPTPSPT